VSRTSTTPDTFDQKMSLEYSHTIMSDKVEGSGGAGEASCPFCNPDGDRILASREHAMAVYDGFPCTEGHTLIVPRRHLASLFEASEEELRDIWGLIGEVRKLLIDKYHTDGFNIGVNEGEAAGQTVMHCHLHVIPRRKGDVPDPRGGIRWVIPEKVKYW